MKVRKVDIINCINKYRAEKLKALAEAKSTAIRHKEALKKFDEDRSNFALKNIPKNPSVSIGKTWNRENDVEITISYHLAARSVPEGLHETPCSPANPEVLRNEIKKAEDRLALIKMSPDDVININSKMDMDALQPYLKHSPIYGK